MRAVLGSWLLILGCAQEPSSSADNVVPESETDDEPVGDLYDPVAREFEWIENPDLDMLAGFPPDPQGIVWAFHGGGGSLVSVLQTEWISIYNELLDRGLGVVLTQSRDRTAGRWSERDVEHLGNILDHLGQTSGITSDLPMGVLAFSNGTHMVSWMLDVEEWDVRAASLHQGSSLVEDIPTLYVSAENDEIGRNEAYYRVSGIVDRCARTAGDCRLLAAEELTLRPLRFTRLPNVSEEDSRAYFADMVRLELVDEDGERLASIDTEADINRVHERLRRGVRNREFVERVATQVRVVWATHRLSAVFAAQEAEFLASHLLTEP